MRLGIRIDKVTKSVEYSITGEEFKTEVISFTKNDFKKLKNLDWLFNWKSELDDASKNVYQLIKIDDRKSVLGLISIEDRGDHIFMHLIESSKPNKGRMKQYLGIPANLVAFACKISFNHGYDGYVSFESKTKLIEHYKISLGAKVIFGNMMAIETKEAALLVRSYFPEIS